MIKKLMRHRFLFEELVKRDFKTKYKRTALGIGWSLLSPLLLLLVLKLVFTELYGRTTPHFSIYLFCGVLVWNYFTEATKGGMRSLMDNAGIFTKVNVPKYLFLLSKNVQALISFLLTLVILFIFVTFDTLTPSLNYLFLLYPIVALVLFNIGTGMILSALYIFFRDTQYLYEIFTRLLMYLSAIFYTVDRFSERAQSFFLLNPLYLFIRYFRSIIIENAVPDLRFHLLIAADVLIVLGLGCWMYKKNNTKFLYYV